MTEIESNVYYAQEYDLVCIIHTTTIRNRGHMLFARTSEIEISGDKDNFSPDYNKIDEILFNKMTYLGEL